MSIVSEIAKPRSTVFRRLFFKRKLNAGYEADWQRIPNKYVMKWGSNSTDASDVKINFFSLSGQSIKVRNDDAFFSEQDNIKSFFYPNAVSRYSTLVKIEAGYIDSTGSEFPTDVTAFYGYQRGDITTNGKSEITFQFRPISAIFQEIDAGEIGGFTGSQTASDIITNLQNYTNGSGDLIFDDLIGDWNVKDTTNIYTTLNTTTAVEGQSVWDLLGKLAESEDATVLVTRNGDFYFVDRDFEASGSNPFHFSGLGDSNKSFGHNIKQLQNFKEPINKVFNNIRIKHDEADTSTSYAIKKDSWTWGDSSSSFKYGVRTLEFDNTLINSTTAQTIASNLFSSLSEVRKEVSIKTKYIPHVEVFNNCTLTYITPRIEGANLWGEFLWGTKQWNSASGRFINIDNKDFRLISIGQDIDNFESVFTMRETDSYNAGYNSSFYNRDSFNE